MLPDTHQHTGTQKGGNKINAKDIAKFRPYAQRRNVTVVTDATYTANIMDSCIWVERTSTGVCTIQLPEISEYNLSNEMIEVIIIDGDGNASSNNITVNAGGSDTIVNDTIADDNGFLKLIGYKGLWIANLTI